MSKLDESGKKAKLIDIFEEAIKLPQCILFLDGIELLIGIFCLISLIAKFNSIFSLECIIRSKISFG